MRLNKLYISIIIIFCMALSAFCQTSRKKININPYWRFGPGNIENAYQVNYNDSKWDIVSLPHTHQIFKPDLSGFWSHGRNIGWYRREIIVLPEWKGKKIFLEFQGAMQTTHVWVNGKFAGAYEVTGFDSYHYDITPYVKTGSNLIAACVDNTLNPDCPPDYLWIDYILFGGLYRDVFLVVTDPVHITFPWESKKAGIRLTLPEVSEQNAVVKAEATVRNESAKTNRFTVITEILDGDGKLVTSMEGQHEIPAGGEFTYENTSSPIANPHLWSPDDPYLYKVKTIVKENQQELDCVQTNLGMRWCRFDYKQGFFLNGKHLKLVGVNYHQAWPFIGNAVPNGLYRRDAEQIKSLGVNWVRLAHYPHDPDFLDYLDELGLMATEEPPTWSGEGNAKWMDNLEKSFRSMIRRDRNHPCLILWSVFINHSIGHPRLINAAIEEDSTRARGQDNVPCPMNFVHKELMGNGALVFEHTGHMFPATRGDLLKPDERKLNDWEKPEYYINREYHQARLHWENIDAAYRKPDNSGLATWSMYDYNTFHNSQDGIARHGIFDLFRIPKYSYWWHKSELTSAPMVYLIRMDSINVCVFSNCEKVRLLEQTGDGYNEVALQKGDTGFVLNHPPFHFTIHPNAFGLKAEGLIGTDVRAVYEWKQPGRPTALAIEVDRPAIIADGSDISRIIVTAIDKNNTAIDTCTFPVKFSIEGLGQIISENPIKLRAGKIIALVQSAFVPSNIKVTAEATGMEKAYAIIKTLPVPADIDMPSVLSVKQPERSLDTLSAVKFEVLPWLEFKSKIDVLQNTWVTSDSIIIPTVFKGKDIEIRGGEYRINNNSWTDKRGKVNRGDIVRVRVRSANYGNAKSWAELTIGINRTRFEVQAK